LTVPVERLHKVLAAAGIASRRASEALIAEGRVTVDGRVASVGDQVDPERAEIAVDGRAIAGSTARVYLALHKPAGVTSTVHDRHAASTVLDHVPTALLPDGARPYPVGRLDRDSEGLILVTNDGDWAERVLHPRFEVEREYAVAVRRPLEQEQGDAIEAGIALDEGLARLAGRLRFARPDDVAALESVLQPPPDPSLAWYLATLRQGWKRQLRRMFAAVDAPVTRLVRVRIGPVRLGGLESGRVRRLSRIEIERLAGRAERPRGRPHRPGRPGGGGTNRPR
jgi:23S rRNA pseudouridine2605 synthase